MRLGRLRQVVPASLAFYFELVSRETVCEGARLEQELVPARAALRGLRARVGDRRCPSSAARAAAARGVTVESGEELEVESIEVEEASACTA